MNILTYSGKPVGTRLLITIFTIALGIVLGVHAGLYLISSPAQRDIYTDLPENMYEVIDRIEALEKNIFYSRIAYYVKGKSLEGGALSTNTYTREIKLLRSVLYYLYRSGDCTDPDYTYLKVKLAYLENELPETMTLQYDE